MSHWIFTEEHKMFRKSVQKYLEKELSPYVEEWEKAGKIPGSFYEQLSKMGYIGISSPEEYGGNHADLVTEAVFLEELGKYGTGGIAASISYHLMSLALLSSFGSEEQKRNDLSKAISGEKIATLALHEIAIGSEELKNTELRAVQDGDDYLLNGKKKFVINGGSSDFICVTAITDPSKGLDGTSLFIIDRESNHVAIDRKIKKLGWRASETVDLSFNNVKVSKDAVVGEVNKANRYLKKSTQWFQVIQALLSIGVAEKSLEDTIRYSKERKQFGRTINHFQVLQHKMADMAVELEKSRNLTYRALYLLNEGQEAAVESAMAKAFAGEMVKQVADSAVQIHGGMGYMMETPVQRYWRDSRGMSIIGGTTESLHRMISKFLDTGKAKEDAEYLKSL